MISEKIRKKFFYTVPAAGKRVGLKRTQSYRAAELGQIPTKRDGKYLLVPRKPWDRQVKQILRGQFERTK
jgi:hypothetical protein